jgi:hypothetical protein
MNLDEAKQAGAKRYIGLPCVACGQPERYTRNRECVACRTAAKCRKANGLRSLKGLKKVGRPRKHPEICGPVKRKRKHWPKPVTEYEKWMHRSKNNKKSSLRSKLTYEIYQTLYVTHCPLLGLELTYSNYHGNIPDNYASLDRIDSSKGYIEGNVQILSFRANTLKGHATLEELKLLVDNWTKQKL